MAKNCIKGCGCGETCIDPNEACGSASGTAAKLVLDSAVKIITQQPKLSEKLGEGDYGVVSLTETGTALKTFTGKYETQKADRAKEIKIATEAGNLRVGPKVLSVLKDAYGKIQGFEMEFLQGKSAEQVAFSPEQNNQVWLQIAKLHANGIAHNDLHTGNVIATDGGVRLLDFGMGKKADVMSFVSDYNNMKKFPASSPEAKNLQARFSELREAVKTAKTSLETKAVMAQYKKDLKTLGFGA